MNGKIVVSSFGPPVNPITETAPPYFTVLKIYDNVFPPTGSIAPAHNCLSNGRTFSGCNASREIIFVAPWNVGNHVRFLFQYLQLLHNLIYVTWKQRCFRHLPLPHLLKDRKSV